jgi:hypothetical protein
VAVSLKRMEACTMVRQNHNGARSVLFVCLEVDSMLFQMCGKAGLTWGWWLYHKLIRMPGLAFERHGCLHLGHWQAVRHTPSNCFTCTAL